MLIFAVKKKRTPSIAPKRHSPTVSPMYHSLHLQQAKVRHILRSLTFQPKLTIGQPNDKYEQEADRVADEVMRMPEPGLQRQVEPEEEEEEETLQPKPLVSQITPLVQVQRQEEPEEEEEELQAKPLSDQITPLVQRQVEPEEEEETPQAKPLAEQITPLVQKQVEPEEEEEEEAIQTKLADGAQVQRQEEPEEEEEEEAIQTKQVSTHTPAVTPNLASRIQSLRGGGQPLPKSARSFFEPRFGYDFSQVRVHRDSRAANVARTINARAFTLGRDIVFGSGEYSPETGERRRMLAHELVHTIQQRNTQTIQRQVPPPPAANINALFVSNMTWLTLKMRDMAGDALDSLKIAHGAFSWGKAIAEYLLSSASTGLGVLIGGGVGSKIFLSILLSSTTSLLQSGVKTQSLSFAKFKTAVKNYINDYLLGPKYGVVAKLKAANAKDKNKLQKVVALLDMSKIPQIKKISQEMAMSTFLAGTKGSLHVNYRAVGPDLSKWSGNLSGTALKWYDAPGRHINFYVPVLRSIFTSTGYTKGMTYLEGVYTGKKVKDVNISDIKVNVSLRFPASKISASKNYFYCYGHVTKGASSRGCRTTGHTVAYSFQYCNGKTYTCSGGLCYDVKHTPQSVVDRNVLWPNSWYNYNMKFDVADKAIAYALIETMPKPR